MHVISIPDSVVERVIARCGKEHVFEGFNPSRSAMVVVDLQNAFMMPGVAHALCETAVEIVPNVNRIASALREAGGTVVWIQTAFTAGILQEWSVQAEMSGPERTEKRRVALTEGSVGHALWDGLDVQAADVFVTKNRYSAFIQGSSDLEQVLRARDIDTVIITGTVTNVCCESTARDAQMRNFRVIMVSDGNAAWNDEEHNATLVSIYLTFGDVMSTDLLVDRINRNATTPAIAAE
jgi:ureidoacrylate peracid hydrolase